MPVVNADLENVDRNGLWRERRAPWIELRPCPRQTLIFKRMIKAVSPRVRPGDVVSVYDRQGALLGCAHYNPHSQIAVRMLRFGAGGVDDDFLRETIARAASLRTDTLRLADTTDAYRVIHAEGDGLSGLVVDRYGEVLSIEIFSLGMYRMIDTLLPILHEVCGTRHHRAATSARVEEREGFTARKIESANLPGEVRILENGVRFRVSFVEGHKTGFFCDQRDNRARLAAFCGGAEVLDACCYSGGFGIYAAVKGGAREVTCVDLDEKAVALAKRNADLNGARVATVHADAFVYLRQMQQNGRSFDVVVLDPPKLIFGPRDEGDGRKKYFDLNRLALPLLRPGGLLLTCSCSGSLSRAAFLDILRVVAHQTGCVVQVLATTGAGPDHPFRADVPEGEYLKALWLRVL